MAEKTADDQNQNPDGDELPPGDEAGFDQLLRQAGLPEDYAQADAMAAARKIASDLSEFKRIRGGVPDQYSFDLPQDFEFPQGYTRDRWKPDQHFVAAISEIAREYGAPQEAITKFAAVYAKRQIAQADAAKQAADAEVAKLGPKGPDRIKAVQQRLVAMLGKDKAAALFQGGTASGIEAMEDLLERANGAGRVAPNKGANGGTGPRVEDLKKLVGTRGGGRAIFGQSFRRSN